MADRRLAFGQLVRHRGRKYVVVKRIGYNVLLSHLKVDEPSFELDTFHSCMVRALDFYLPESKLIAFRQRLIESLSSIDGRVVVALIPFVERNNASWRPAVLLWGRSVLRFKRTVPRREMRKYVLRLSEKSFIDASSIFNALLFHNTDERLSPADVENLKYKLHILFSSLQPYR